MREIKVAVIAHGLGMSKTYSGEGNVYKTVFEMLNEEKIQYIAVSFSKPYDLFLPSVYSLPFHLSKFDKYQRLLSYYTAKKVKPKLYINLSGVPLPLSNLAPHIIYAGAPSISNVPSKYNRSLIWKLYLLPFRTIVNRMKDEAKRAKIIANSRYSAKAIAEVYNIQEPEVIYPPVDVEFYSKAYNENSRDNAFLTIGRIERGKMLENSILLSAKTGIKGIIVGSLNEKSYMQKLIKLRNKLNADIEIYTNLGREELLKIMEKVKIYFHPTMGEHFGIPVIEAMSSGLIPIVPKESGAYEIVPEFSYSDIDEASKILKDLIEDKRDIEIRREMKKRSLGFDKVTFKNKFMSKILTLIS
ncbi:glycosyl transferase family 1 [Sulfolobus sp. A20]|uniref:glycosyltransferase family 4 protein n=1 Tax=Sulfolobaceae TaxID=118883 RepID=UPI000845C29C|nr:MULTISPECIES: glycosyltransferase family 4 protein [unclassified Sulfolobus]TRM74843.1 glycosyltransferase family 1 protein [Sulfolobus sp. E5]TRM79166.1 glycosyltransferase family 1 protein [Sulfolobus sp. B5]TRM82232.1 glycosyltransferase family 1 protein [Sulfolobus sp. A20-N-F6]TRM84746.1 glycosyltransferase family 1 protein [Sulfolobus sp. F3]TRM89239.1 glycosyltransferase family 1 protein [Sulfolobus sp. C3]TRM98854.1 glycosyltransferase family 1 protein [Sulfolobus sp. E1]TRN01382.